MKEYNFKLTNEAFVDVYATLPLGYPEILEYEVTKIERRIVHEEEKVRFFFIRNEVFFPIISMHLKESVNLRLFLTGYNINYKFGVERERPVGYFGRMNRCPYKVNVLLLTEFVGRMVFSLHSVDSVKVLFEKQCNGSSFIDFELNFTGFLRKRIENGETLLLELYPDFEQTFNFRMLFNQLDIVEPFEEAVEHKWVKAIKDFEEVYRYDLEKQVLYLTNDSYVQMNRRVDDTGVLQDIIANFSQLTYPNQVSKEFKDQIEMERKNKEFSTDLVYYGDVQVISDRF